MRSMVEGVGLLSFVRRLPLARCAALRGGGQRLCAFVGMRFSFDMH
jgi:hypothetical protein